ncbi:pyridoxal-phosphate-dependent aminotransferase family protein [Rathayibacter toxicus]|uniref:Alanine--glyoxylate aminotransferase family protein n=1 Tax=Rathayibacter toxicus TaxID=145458 RepID=A0A2S5Y8J3_9MICO|nr:alanine--glyoxylate aminotransferase family protein [Rathayibacter toxicus]PPH24783.1 alanine--glyoxylate aminotransferase family protein [Rathayibacter toxicus]PPH58711.1 alanine--glyoxylate aminotransferase family protein [Rathayibacter toxicus]PPH60703.1 alanine--glyoxylate aminotransferase family protein [Rathayibacter toxicus]PPH88523.1 alanine--glyoxylate aminotransferase family protein [Rathayibacter toxicus]PPI16216.1 alanine--glyoxylate aminotransferase family protein [Rathayibacte
MKTRLATPGPTEVPDEIRLAGARPIIHHRSPSMELLMERIARRLRPLFRTERDVFVSLTSGTGAMEAAVANLFGPEDHVLIVTNGYFGERFEQIAQAYGVKSLPIRSDWGTSVDIDAVRDAYAAHPDITGVLVVHSETSTGALNDVEAIGRLFAGTDVVVVVDAISSLITHRLEMDEWGLDVVLAASHKAFMMPPGLAFIAISEKAQKKSMRSPRPAYYWSFERLKKFHPLPPSSPAVSLLFSLDVALDHIEGEGLPRIQQRAADLAEATLAGLLALGFRPLVIHPHYRNNVVTSVLAPEGVDTNDLQSTLEDEWGVTVTGGQAHLKGSLLRVGHVGAADFLDVVSIMAAIELVLASDATSVSLGTGVAAYLKAVRQRETR